MQPSRGKGAARPYPSTQAFETKRLRDQSLKGYELNDWRRRRALAVIW